MTTTEGEVELRNRLRLTFEDAGDDLGIDEVIDTLHQAQRLCEAVTWLSAYDAGVPLSWRYFEDPSNWSPRETLVRTRPSASTRMSLFPHLRRVPQDQVFVWPRSQSRPPQWATPTVPRLSKQSPMVVDLVIQSVPYLTGGVVITALIAALKNPQNIGAWLPSLAAGWHQGRTEMLRSQLEALIAAEENEAWKKRRPGDFQGDASERQDSIARELRYHSGIGSSDDAEAFAQVQLDRDAQTMQAVLAARNLRRNGLSLVQDEPIPEDPSE